MTASFSARKSFDYHTPSDQWPTFGEWCAAQTHFMRWDRNNTEIDSWIVVPYTYCPNVAEILDESNHQALLSALDAAGEDDYIVRRHNHWATPYEMILVRPGSAAFDAADQCIAALADYPVLDESDFSDREYAQQHADIADGLASLTVLDADGDELDTSGHVTLADGLPDPDLRSSLVHQIWEHMWNDGQPWRCLEETGQDGGGGADREDVERALTEMGYVYDETEMVWRAEK